MTYRVEYAERVILMLGRFMDDPEGLSEALAVCDRLAEDPFPADSVSYGKSHRRLHIGVYRATYEIGDNTITIINMARRIRRVLLAMVRTRGGAADASRAVVRREHLGDDWRVAEALAQASRRLVVLGPDGPGTAEIAHEALIREWERLAAWVNADAEFQRWLTVTEERAADDLLPEALIGEAQQWLAERRADVPTEVADLIERSQSTIQERADELLERKRTEQLLAESQRIMIELQDRSSELQRVSKELRRSNVDLEEKASLLAKENRAIELQNFQIEQDRRTLEERAEQLALSCPAFSGRQPKKEYIRQRVYCRTIPPALRAEAGNRWPSADADCCRNPPRNG